MSGAEDRDAFLARMEEQYGTQKRPETAEAFLHRMDRTHHRLSAGKIERHARQLGAGIVEFAAPVMKYPGVLLEQMGVSQDIPISLGALIPGHRSILPQTIGELRGAGTEASEAAENIAPPEIMAGSWTERAARAAPSVPKYLAASAVGGPAGVAGLGAIENAVSSYERALDLTGDPKKAKVAFAVGHLIGSLESIGGVGGKAVHGNILRRIIFGGKDELLQEALSAGLNAKSLELISGMDLDVAREMWDEGSIGALFGAGTHAVMGSRYDEGQEPKPDYGEHPPQLEGVREPRKPAEPGGPASAEDIAWARRFLQKTTGHPEGTPPIQEEPVSGEMQEAMSAMEEAEAAAGKRVTEEPKTRQVWQDKAKKTLQTVDPNLEQAPSDMKMDDFVDPDNQMYQGDYELRKKLEAIGKEHGVPQTELEDAHEELKKARKHRDKTGWHFGRAATEDTKTFNERIKRWIKNGYIAGPVEEPIEPTPLGPPTEEVGEGNEWVWPKEAGTTEVSKIDPNLERAPAGAEGSTGFPGIRKLKESIRSIADDWEVPDARVEEAEEAVEAAGRRAGKTGSPQDVMDAGVKAYNEHVRRWSDAGWIPPRVRQRKSRPSRRNYYEAIENVGKAVGASDEDIHAAQEALRTIPGELDVDEEYVRVAKALRERAAAGAKKGAPFPPRPVGPDEPPLPDTRTKETYLPPRKVAPAVEAQRPKPTATVVTPRRRELDLRPEDVAAEEQLKGQAEVAGGGILKAHEAETDPKTGLLNAAGFKRNAREIAEKAKRMKKRMVVIFVDLRDLTGLNKLFGHQVADEVIGHDFGPDDRKGFVGAWGEIARAADARGVRLTGGDEFGSAGVVSQSADPTVILDRIEGMADEVLKEYGLEGKIAGRKFGADAGWAEVDLSNPDLDAAIKEAMEKADQMSQRRKTKRAPSKKKLSAKQWERLAPKAQKERARRLAARKAQGGAQEPTAQMAKQPGGSGTTGMASTKPAASSADPEPLFGGIPGSTSGLMQSAKQGKKALRDWMQKQLLSRGFTPEEARRITEEAEGEIAAMDRYVRITRRALEKARKKSDVSLEELRDALEDPAKLAALPEPVRTAAAKARADIDRLSRLFVSKGLVRGKLAEAFKKGEGQYLHRTYRAHHDPNWSDVIPQEIKNRLHSLLMNYAQPLSKAERTALMKRARAGDREARWEVGMRRAFKGMDSNAITNEINGILKEAQEHALNPWVHLTKGKLGRKDLSLFMKRKGLPEEFRELLGEEKNPLVNYADTMLRLSTFLARSRQFLRMRHAGLRDGWLSEKRTDTNLVQISSEQNKALAPLNGLYTSPEIKAALLEEAPKVGGMVEQTIRGVGGWWKRAKTIENIPLGPLKQIAQNFELFISVGHPVHYPKALYYAWKATTGSLDPKVQRYIELNLIQTGVLQSELDELWRNFKRQRGPRATLKEFERHLGEQFGIGDNAARIAFFEHKKKVLEKAGYAEDEAERIAADQALNAVPTPMRLPRLAKTIRPYSGLISYAVERVRTIANLIQISVAEIRSDNPVLQKNGAITLARMAAVGYGFRALRQWINALNGIDDEEEADMDRLTDYWARGKTPVRLGDSKSGRFFDLSQFDHLAWISEPVAALLSGNPKRALGALHDELIDPFITIPFFETVMGKTAAQFVSELAGFEKPKREKGTAQERFLKEVVPGTPGLGWVFPMKDFIKRIHEIPSDIFPALLGARSYKYDPMGTLVKNARYAQGQLVGVSEKTTEKLTDTSRETLEGAVAYADKSRAQIFEELHLDVEAAVRLGFTKREIFQSLLAGGISEENALAIMAGVVPSSRKLVGDKALEKRREEALAR